MKRSVILTKAYGTPMPSISQLPCPHFCSKPFSTTYRSPLTRAHSHQPHFQQSQSSMISVQSSLATRPSLPIHSFPKASPTVQRATPTGSRTPVKFSPFHQRNWRGNHCDYLSSRPRSGGNHQV